MITQEIRKESIASVLAWAKAEFISQGFETAELEARVLLGGFLEATSTDLILKSAEGLSVAQAGKFRELVDRRVKHEPAAYILGNANFMGIQVQVDGRVLIPRPETELLVEEALRELEPHRDINTHLLDVGTGSGCIAIALARGLPKASVLAVDNSLGALKVAQVNLRQNKVSERVALLLSDGYEALPAEKTGSFDMIVSNPPYIASSELTRLEPELSFEPRQALDGGSDGLSIIRRLITGGPKFLRTNGVLMLEIGHDQGVEVKELLQSNGYQAVSVLKDHSGHDRIAKGTFVGPI